MFRIPRIGAEGKGVVLLFWGFWKLFRRIMIDFKFGSNRTAGSKGTMAHGRRSHHPISGRIRLPCLRRYKTVVEERVMVGGDREV